MTPKQLRARKTGLANKKHGRAHDPIYTVWSEMRCRCNNKNHRAYPSYGGRGIRVCERWNSFDNFLTDMGDRPSTGHSLDRINNDGDYTPENCRWTDRLTQQNNTRLTKLLTARGKTLSISQWARELGVSRNRIRTRIQNGDSVEAALFDPKRHAWTKQKENNESK